MSKPDLSTYGGRLRDLGYAGQIVDTNPATIESKTNEAATAIDYGIAVARGAADDTCKAPTADGDKLIGISVRHAIRPAIGSRCSLDPSCSEYFRQASRNHGLLSIPMIADRLVREPSVVLKREREIVVGGETRIADPLSDHDQWMK